MATPTHAMPCVTLVACVTWCMAQDDGDQIRYIAAITAY